NIIIIYKWKRGHNAAAAARNINAAIGDGTVNDRTIRHWYPKYGSGDEILTNKDWGRPETVANNEVLPSDSSTKSRE
ncbi:hypothetical protein TNCT_557561, partial [Trichonephila clavata]